MRLSRLFGAFCIASMLTACAVPLPSAGPGLLFTSAKEGISANNNVPQNKNGEACAINVLGIVSMGDATVYEATRKARITQVATIDRSYFGVLGIFSQGCTLVTGD
jgi:hypothetical protein